ncbi:hypothetical protein LPJ66_012095, partial [Kickxella alabastrina]
AAVKKFKQSLRCCFTDQPDEEGWTQYIPRIVAAHACTRSEAIANTPAAVFFGEPVVRIATTYAQLPEGESPPSEAEITEMIREQAAEHREMVRQRANARDNRGIDPIWFEPGEWVTCRALPKASSVADQFARRLGPFRVVSRHKTSYHLAYADGKPFHRIVPGDAIMRYHHGASEPLAEIARRSESSGSEWADSEWASSEHGGGGMDLGGGGPGPSAQRPPTHVQIPEVGTPMLISLPSDPGYSWPETPSVGSPPESHIQFMGQVRPRIFAPWHPTILEEGEEDSPQVALEPAHIREGPFTPPPQSPGSPDSADDSEAQSFLAEIRSQPAGRPEASTVQAVLEDASETEDDDDSDSADSNDGSHA